MTPRERILRTVNHQRPDRVPTTGWFHPEVQQALIAHYHAPDWETVLAALGIEGWSDLGPGLAFDEFEQNAAPRPGHPQGPKALWLDSDTYEDCWGIRWRVGQGDRYQEWLDGPLAGADSPAAVYHYRFPSVGDIREPAEFAAEVARRQQAGLFVSSGFDNPFKRFWHLRGYENALMDYLSDRAIVDAVYDRLFDLTEEMTLCAARAGVDMISIVGDIAMQDRLLLPPEVWRAIDKPRWVRLIQACRAVKPDLHFFFHSDGALTDLVDDLVHAGFDVINPIQPECMDPREVKRRWGDRITLHGCISIQRTLPFGTVDDVRAEVEGLIRDCGRDGGLVLMPSNVMQPDTPLANIIACFETARDLKLDSH